MVFIIKQLFKEFYHYSCNVLMVIVLTISVPNFYLVEHQLVNSVAIVMNLLFLSCSWLLAQGALIEAKQSLISYIIM